MSMPNTLTYMQPEGLRKVGWPHARWRDEVWKDARMLEQGAATLQPWIEKSGIHFWRSPRIFMSCGANYYYYYGFCPSSLLKLQPVCKDVVCVFKLFNLKDGTT